MKRHVSVKMAHVLRDYGFPQRLRVGDRIWHPLAEKEMTCLKTNGKISDVENPVVKIPTESDAIAFINTLSAKTIVDLNRDLGIAV